METIKKYWAALAGLVAGFIGLLLFFLQKKNKEVEELNAKVDMAKTEKETDVLESQIKTLRADKDNLAKHNDELDKSIQKVQDKRVEVAAQAKELKDPKAIADYWNHQ